MIKKINIDLFDSIKKFEYYFFRFLKNESNSIYEKKILIFTVKQDKEVLNYISNYFIYKLDKISFFLDKNNFSIKILNIPFCIIKNTKIIEKYLENPLFKNFEDILIKENKICLQCRYYTTCLGVNKNNIPIINNFYRSDNLLSKEDYI